MEQWLTQSRQGSSHALNQLVETCREYLTRIAQNKLPKPLRAKTGVSDIVQETFLEAQRDFHQFRGSTQREFMAWLQTILLNNVRNITRQYVATARRELRREIPLDDLNSAARAALGAVAKEKSPSQKFTEQERQQVVAEAISGLPRSMQRVLYLRHRKRLRFADIGERIDRSPEAARKLWRRAINRLQGEIRKRSIDSVSR